MVTQKSVNQSQSTEINMKKYSIDWETEEVAHLMKLRKCILLEKTTLQCRLNEITKWMIEINQKLELAEFINLKESSKQQNSKSYMSEEVLEHLKSQNTKQVKSTTSAGTKNSKTGSVTVGITQTEQHQTESDGDTAPTSWDSYIKKVQKNSNKK